MQVSDSHVLFLGCALKCEWVYASWRAVLANLTGARDTTPRFSCAIGEILAAPGNTRKQLGPAPVHLAKNGKLSETRFRVSRSSAHLGSKMAMGTGPLEPQWLGNTFVVLNASCDSLS